MKHINSFNGGMKRDYNENYTQANTYLESLNGRLVFNENNNTLAWTFANGTTFVFNLNANEEIVGGCESNNKLILLVTNGVTSRIVGLKEDQFGVYAIYELFNDDYDPYNDRLNFRNRCKVNSIVENDGIERIYWNDDRNDPRVFNLFALGDWGAAYNPPYPNYYSVHSMDRMIDLHWGNIRFYRNISGTLTVAKRQYFYRYIHKNGYTSPWSPISEAIFITSDEPNLTDWNEYEMEVSGTSTKKGHMIRLTDLDVRFNEVEVGCVVWETDEAPKRAYVFQKLDITASTIDVSHISDVGNGILLEEINQRYFDVSHAKTQNIKNNFLHEGNIVLREQPLIADEVLNAITITPIIREMLSDETNTKFQLPLTNQAPKTTFVTKGVFGAVTETLPIVQDYINYKGTQWEHTFKGHFRGGLYPYSIVLFDRKGQPCFAQYIGDFQFPEQYNNNWSLRRPSGTTVGTTGSIGDYTLTIYDPATGATDPITDTIFRDSNHALKILGAKFSGIDLTDIIYDADGKIQLSGFSIIRSDRVPDIICQGLLLNCTVEVNEVNNESPFPDALGYERNIPKVQPLHSHGSLYLYKNTLPNTRPFYSQGITPVSSVVTASDDDHGSNKSGGRYVAQHTFTFEAPDFLIDSNVINTQGTNKFKIVGNCQLSFNSPKFDGQPIVNTRSYASAFSGGNNQWNTKHYSTLMGGVQWVNDLDGAGSVGIGNVQPFVLWGTEKNADEIKAPVFKEEFYTIGDGYYLISNWETFLNGYQALPPTEDWQARGHQNSIYVSAKFGNLLSFYTPWINPTDMITNRSSYFIANYRTGLDGYVLDDNIVKNRVYKNIGHFIPINPTTISQATSGGRIVFDDVEVWGGDCFVDFFDYCRLVPLYEEDPENRRDYGLGLIFPTESKFNFTMKKGSRYARVGSRSQANDISGVLGGDMNEMMQDGIFQSRVSDYYRLEEFNVNKVLQTPDENLSVNKYFVRNDCGLDRTDFPLMYIHSELKYLGECNDSFRKFKVNNFAYADGKHGSITEIVDLFDANYIIQEGALSKMRFNERTMLQAAQNQLTVGSGKGYDGQEYIHTDYGSQHQWSVIANGRSIYGVDANKGKQWRFGQDGFNIISDTFGMHNFFTEQSKYYWKKPYVGADIYESLVNEGNFDDARIWGGIHSIFDFKNNSLITTFSNRNGLVKTTNGDNATEYTIEYNEESNKYTSFHSFKPFIYCNLKRSFYSQNNTSLYKHDEGTPLVIYGVDATAELVYNTTPNPNTQKIYDNIRMSINPEGMNNLFSWEGITEENDSHLISLNTDSRVRYREGFLTFPTRELKKPTRLRGKFAKNKFTFIRFASDRAIIPLSECEFRISNKY
jgi:hypothetical protein